MTQVSSQFSGVALIPHGVTALVTLATLVPAGHRSSRLSAATNKPASDSCFLEAYHHHHHPPNLQRPAQSR